MKDFVNTMPTGLYEYPIGEKNQDYYLDKFEDFDQKGAGWHASWNWAAFFFTGLWALYRKMYGWFVIWLIVLMFFRVFPIGTPSTQTALAMLLVNIALWLGFTVFANSLYHRKVKARLAAAKNSNSNALRASRKLSAGGGVHTWVPIVFGVIPIIGIVAAVALPAYQDYTKRTQNVAGVAAAKPADEPDASNPYGRPEVVAGVAATNAANEPAAQVDWNKGVITPSNQFATYGETPKQRSQIDEFLGQASHEKSQQPASQPVAINWVKVEDSGTVEVSPESIVRDGVLLRYSYRERMSYQHNEATRLFTAAVHCDTRQRAEIQEDKSINLAPVFPGTRRSAELNYVCTSQYAASPRPPVLPTEEHYRRIYAAHHDADAIHNSPIFQAWVAKYPAYKRIVTQGTTQETIEMFTAYKNQR